MIVLADGLTLVERSCSTSGTSPAPWSRCW